MRQNTLLIAGVLALYVLMVTGIYLMPGDLPSELVRENGVVENLSAGGHFFFCFVLLYLNLTGMVKTGPAPGLFVLLLGLRELDFHERFTTMGMFKIKFFLSPEVSWPEKMVVMLLIAGLVAYGVVYVRKILPGCKKALLDAGPWAVSVVCGVACALISKLVLDGNSDMIAFLLPMLDNPRVLSGIMEECLELFIPVFFIMALIQYIAFDKKDHRDLARKPLALDMGRNCFSV
ncbi:MAG: hypothetical protein LC657_17435 [Desulfobacteraceae bacterium]|nr:hypothetical protein [Desulfobacteraceae bacterium]